MLRLVSVLIIKMHKSPFYLLQQLQLLLQRFSNVVSHLQRHISRKNDINLHKVMRPKRVSPHCVDMPYGFMVVPTQVSQFLRILWCCCFPN